MHYTGVVEKVLTGDRLIVRLQETPTNHVQTLLLIAGIRAPNTKRVNNSEGTEHPAEPLGEEAHEFVETRLLQRKVTVTPVGISPQGALIGSVNHPNGEISVFLLKAGLARCMDQHSTLLGQNMALLREAEKYAKDNRVGIFTGATAPRSSGKENDAIVTRIQSADTLYLRFPDNSERRVNLSSVRQPKPSDPKQSPFGAEAKEFMRKRLIGKHVKVSIDGKRPASEGFDEREMGTITQGGKNIGLALVENGYASVLRHRMDDMDRSPVYDELLAAEETAQGAGRGMWSGKPRDATQYVDYSESLDKAKRLLTLLSRQKRVPAVVDFVRGGSRFVLLIPRENAKLTFVLSGVNVPKSARSATDQAEPFGQDAHDLANRRVAQRDVEVDVEDTDKVGGFIGKMYVNGENFARTLLEHGFASVRGYSAEKSGNAAELLAAEKRAKEERKGLWVDWDPSAEAVDEQDVEIAEEAPIANGASNGVHAQMAPSKDYRDVVVTHIDATTCRLKVQQISNATTGALTALMSSLRQLHLSGSAPSALTAAPKTGDMVAARFSADGEWYRARVRRNDHTAKTSEILFVDYGNAETTAWTSLRPIDTSAGSRFGAQALRPQALDAALSFVQFPASIEYVADAATYLSRRLVESGAQMVARVDFVDARENGLLWVTLFDARSAGEEEGSVNAEVVAEGMGMIGRKLRRWEAGRIDVVNSLKAREQEAKSERRGMWEYGELDDE